MKVINGIKMFSTKEIQELLGISLYTIAKLRKTGQIRSVTLGRARYTSEESLADYLNGKTIPNKKQQ